MILSSACSLLPSVKIRGGNLFIFNITSWEFNLELCDNSQVTQFQILVPYQC